MFPVVSPQGNDRQGGKRPHQGRLEMLVEGQTYAEDRVGDVAAIADRQRCDAGSERNHAERQRNADFCAVIAQVADARQQPLAVVARGIRGILASHRPLPRLHAPRVGFADSLAPAGELRQSGAGGRLTGARYGRGCRRWPRRSSPTCGHRRSSPSRCRDRSPPDLRL